jgi:hypothetical protein
MARVLCFPGERPVTSHRTRRICHRHGFPLAVDSITPHGSVGRPAIARGLARERKVRTPLGSRPWRIRGRRRRKLAATESVTENQTARHGLVPFRVRVKRRGKSPPPARQRAGHEKPPAVQDKTGGQAPGRPAQAGQPPGNSRTPLLRSARSRAQAQPPAREMIAAAIRERKLTDRRSQNPAYGRPNEGALGKPGAPFLLEEADGAEPFLGRSPTPLPPPPICACLQG